MRYELWTGHDWHGRYNDWHGKKDCIRKRGGIKSACEAGPCTLKFIICGNIDDRMRMSRHSLSQKCRK